MEKQRTPWSQAHTRNFPRRPCVCCWVGSQEEDFFFIRLGRSQAALRVERHHVNWLQEPKDALGRDNHDLVLFEDETEARPSLVGA